MSSTPSAEMLDLTTQIADLRRERDAKVAEYDEKIEALWLRLRRLAVDSGSAPQLPLSDANRDNEEGGESRHAQGETLKTKSDRMRRSQPERGAIRREILTYLARTSEPPTRDQIANALHLERTKVQYALQDLKTKLHLVENPSRGQWALTDKGRMRTNAMETEDN